MIKAGFTIVELLIVIVVIAILAAITMVAYRNFSNQAEEAVVQSDLTQASKQLALDNAAEGTYPSGSGSAPGSLSASDGTAFEYTSDGSTYCLSAVRGNKSYHITNGSSPKEGVCSGHSGPVMGGGGSLTCEPGYIPVPGDSRFGTSDFCVMKYEAKNVAGVPTGQASGLPWTNIRQTDAITVSQSACTGCHLITEPEWMTIAANVLSVSSNWSEGAVGSGYIYSGHNDNNPSSRLEASGDNDGYYGTGNTAPSNQRRTLALTNGAVIWDMAGNAWEWSNATIAGNQQPGAPSDSVLFWRQWNNGALNFRGLPSTSRPSPDIASYASSQGVGALKSNYNDSQTKAFNRGGGWNQFSNAGVLNLDFTNYPSDSQSHITFRVAYTP